MSTINASSIQDPDPSPHFGHIFTHVLHEENKKTTATLEGAKNTVDDITVYSKTPEPHDKALKDTLQGKKSNGLTLNCAKCLFDQPRIEFFGFALLARGVSPDPAKVQALREAEQPTNAEEVRSFLGIFSPSM